MQSYYYNLAIKCYENLTNNKFFPVDINEKKGKTNKIIKHISYII